MSYIHPIRSNKTCDRAVFSIALYVYFISGSHYSTAGDEIPTPDQVIENIRSSESPFENMEIILSIELTMPEGAKKYAPNRATAKSTESVRCVYQNGMIYQKISSSSKSNEGKVSDYKFLSCYDGSTRKTLAGNVANVVHETIKSAFYQYEPHNLLFSGGGEEFLHETLKSGDKINTRSGVNSGATIHRENKIEKIEILDGSPCVVFVHKHWLGRKRDDNGFLYKIWIDLAKNHIPARFEGYALKLSSRLPQTVSRVVRWEEIKPGLWIPKELIVDRFDQKVLLRQKTQLLSQRATILVKKFDLNPEYPIELFRSVDFPDKSVVYELKNDKIIKSYKINMRNMSSKYYLVNRGVILTVLFVVSLFALWGVVVYRRGNRLKFGSTGRDENERSP
jgi:hypothetical protein